MKRLAQSDSNPKANATVDSVPAIITINPKAKSPSIASSRRRSQLRRPAGFPARNARRNMSLPFPMIAMVDHGGNRLTSAACARQSEMLATSWLTQLDYNGPVDRDALNGE